MMDAELKKAIRFFVEHAGHATPPGRLACAKSLALAERQARERGWIFQWDEDACADRSFLEDESESYRERSYFMRCVLRAPDEDGTILAALHGIHFLQRGPRNTEHRETYGRVVEAELACEALADERATLEEDRRVIAAWAL
jgi:hypothetical protein